MVLIMAVVSFILFLIFDSPTSSKQSRATMLGARLSQPSSASCGSTRTASTGPFFVRYGEWVGNALRGDFGQSIRSRSAGRGRCSGKPADQHRHPGLLGLRADDPARRW